MFTKSRARRSAAAFTLVETLIAFGLSGIIITGVMASFLGCGRNLLSLSYYTQLNQNSQEAIDRMTREIRGVACLTNFSTISFTNSTLQGFSAITNAVTFIPAGVTMTNTNVWITYFYNIQNGTLTRTQSGTNQILMSNLTFVNFQLFQRNQSNGTFVPIPTSSPAQTKLVQVNWICAGYNPLLPSQTESLESAKVVIRDK